MCEKDEIRVFLESPCTNEFASEADIEQKHKMVPKKLRRRKQRLPPYVPFKSIYEESDMYKLTERQRIIAQKFKSAGSRVSSLFLAVNDISLPQGSDNEDICISEDAERNPFDQLVSADEESNISEQCTKGCLVDAKRLYCFTNWLIENNSVLKADQRKAKRIVKALDGILLDGKCICATEERIYKRIYNLIENIQI